jgi:FtsH-binding integral membrane protein
MSIARRRTVGSYAIGGALSLSLNFLNVFLILLWFRDGGRT